MFLFHQEYWAYSSRILRFFRKLKHIFLECQSIWEFEQRTLDRALEGDVVRLVDLNVSTHRPGCILSQSNQRVTRSMGNVQRLSRAYFNLHEYLCATCGAARLRFSPAEFVPLLNELEMALNEAVNEAWSLTKKKRKNKNLAKSTQWANFSNAENTTVTSLSYYMQYSIVLILYALLLPNSSDLS